MPVRRRRGSSRLALRTEAPRHVARAPRGEARRWVTRGPSAAGSRGVSATPHQRAARSWASVKVRGAVGAAFAGAEGVSSDALWKLLSELSNLPVVETVLEGA